MGYLHMSHFINHFTYGKGVECQYAGTSVSIQKKTVTDISYILNTSSIRKFYR